MRIAEEYCHGIFPYQKRYSFHALCACFQRYIANCFSVVGFLFGNARFTSICGVYGGTLVEVRYPEAANLEKIREVLKRSEFGEAQVQNFGSPQDVMIRVPLLTEGDSRTQGESVMTLLKDTGRMGSCSASSLSARKWAMSWCTKA
ncbi:MAG: hypothetical protein R3E67_02695 [Pseudomonadales bacterium]